MAAMTSGKPLASFSRAWHSLPQTIDAVERTTNASDHGGAAVPVGMVRVPATARYRWESVGMEIEGGHPSAKRTVDQAALIVDVQYPWESMPTKRHARNLSMPAFFIDRTPVTCGESFLLHG
jgi:iron(II)-dependent oxidoreductase